MDVQLIEYELACNCNYRLYNVILDEDDTEIETSVTVDPSTVSSWIKKIETENGSRLHRLIVGLDIEWRPNFNPVADRNPVATIQLCVGESCIIYQVLHSNHIPRRLRNFLNNDDYRFVGVGIRSDVDKLWEDYDLEVSNVVDLREWAAEELNKKKLLNKGLKYLGKKIAGIEIEKPKSVTTSAWDQRWLSRKQICYACLDAYISFEVGRVLSAWY
ncbi:Werner Syndrome-like exonuclease [Solanum stenotomum]|uniref:Werner Syndrome-like exonuclease n=1 Tax=Solanum stenotomum TaxID=172797 RepID=UPI0020D12F4C|nr:Werner Syndrome-like exonuclease [Solanum stenotomum]